MARQRFLLVGLTFAVCLCGLLLVQLARIETVRATPLNDPEDPSYNPDLYFPSPPPPLPTLTPEATVASPQMPVVAIEGASAQVDPGTTTTYTLSVHNPTTATLNDLTLATTLPTTLTFDLPQTEAITYTPATGAVVWAVPPLAPDAGFTTTLTATIPATTTDGHLLLDVQATGSVLTDTLETWDVTTIGEPDGDGAWITPEGGGFRSAASPFTLLVPQGALEKPLYFEIESLELLTPTTPTLWTYAEFTARDSNNEIVSQFAQSLTLSVHVSAFVEQSALTATPGIYWWDETEGELRLMPGEFNWKSGMLTAQVDHFSGFGAGSSEVGSYGNQHLPSINGFVSDPSSGNSVAQYPFLLPPTPGGVPFGLGLSYSSEVVNSLLGMDYELYGSELPQYKSQAGLVGWGWNLTGLGYIRRDNSRGNHAEALLAFPEGTFELKRRQELTDTAIWDTDPQTFVRIESNATSAREASEWMVWSKDGTKYIFGSSTITGSAVAYAALVRYPQDDDDHDFCDGDEGRPVLRDAALREIVDTHGNRVVVDYAREDMNYIGCDDLRYSYTHAIRPTLIEYFPYSETISTAKIEFDYEDDRTDAEVPGHGVDRVQAYFTAYRLTDIRAYVRDNENITGWSLFRHYDLDHTTVPFPNVNNQGIMLLDGVWDGGSIEDSSYYPTTTFGYEKLEENWLNSYALVSANNGQGGQVEYGYDDAEVEIHPCAIWGFSGSRPGEAHRFYVDALTTTDGITTGGALQVAARQAIEVSGGWAQGGRFNSSGVPSGDCAERFEFAGYRVVTTTRQSPTGSPLQVQVTEFHQNYAVWNGQWLELFVAPEAGKGKEMRLYDPTPNANHEGLLQIVNTTWVSETSLLTYGKPWVYKAGEVVRTIDPVDPALSVTLTTTYGYITGTHQNWRQYGNVTHIREYDEEGLFRLRDFFFSPYSTTTDYIVNKPRNQRVWTGEAGAGGSVCLSHVVMAYDNQTWPTAPTDGNVTAMSVATHEGVAENGCDGGYLGTLYDYDPYGNQTVVTDTRGYATVTEYDTDNSAYPALFAYPLTVTAPSVNAVDFVSHYTWDATVGQVVTATDANNIATHYTYDEFGRLRKMWKPGDSSTYPTQWYTYTNYLATPLSPYRVESSQRMSGTVRVPTWIYYDGLGRELQGWSLYYDPTAGQIAATTLTHYDPMGGAGVVYAPKATTETVQFIGAGAFWTGQPSTTTSYDAYGRAETIRATDGTTMTHFQGVVEIDNTMYHRTALIDANHHRAVTLQDAVGRTVYALEYSGNCANWQPGYACGEGPPTDTHPYYTEWTRYATTTYAYDAADRLLTVTDAVGNETAMTYDLAGRKLGMNDPDMGAWQYRYDNAGNLLAQLDAAGNGICFTYDALGRPTVKKAYDTISGSLGTFCNNSPTYSVNYTYDTGTHGIGRRTGMSDPTGSAAWRYDSRGRVISETKSITVATTAYEFTTLSTYDAADRVRSVQYPADAGGGVGEVVAYDYTDGHQMMLRGVSSISDTYLSGIEYNVFGQVVEQVYGTSTPVTQAYTYWPLTTRNGQGRLREMTAVRGTVMDALLAFQYETGWDSGYPGYDAVGNVENIMERRWITTTTSIDQRQEFFYDDLDRLSSAQVFNIGGGGSGTGILAQEEYTYDQIGNLTTRYVNDLQPNPETEYGYDTPVMTGCPVTADDTPKAHAVYTTTGRMTNTYCYDAVGNMVHRQMVTSDTVSQTLVYDAENRLQHLYNDPDSINAIASFHYDGDGNRVRATMGGVITLYVGLTEYRIEVGSPNTETLVTYYMGSGQKIAMREQVVGGSAELYYLLGDHLGSTSTTLDEDGYKIADLRYAAWGTTRWTDGEIPTRRRYTGQIQDVETGLYFYNARYYDPALARFIQADTIVPEPSNPQTLNRFSYVSNNPVKYTDPSGHQQCNKYDQCWWEAQWYAARGICGAQTCGVRLHPEIAHLLVQELFQDLGMVFDNINAWSLEELTVLTQSVIDLSNAVGGLESLKSLVTPKDSSVPLSIHRLTGDGPSDCPTACVVVNTNAPYNIHDLKVYDSFFSTYPDFHHQKWALVHEFGHVIDNYNNKKYSQAFINIPGADVLRDPEGRDNTSEYWADAVAIWVYPQVDMQALQNRTNFHQNFQVKWWLQVEVNIQ